MATKINERQEAFLQVLIKKRKKDGSMYSKPEAYQEIYGVKNRHTAKNNANRLLTNAVIRERKEELEQEVKDEVTTIFQGYAKEAAAKIIELSKDQRRPDVALKASNDALKYSGLEPASKSELDVTDDRQFNGLNDDQSYNEIITQAYKQINHPEND